MPMEYCVPLTVVSPVVSALAVAVAFQTRQVIRLTRRMEKLHDEDRKDAKRHERDSHNAKAS